MAEVITDDMIIGEVLRRHPESEAVFKKYFGKGCFTCPGSDNEDIAFGAMMHNSDLAAILEALNAAIKKQG
ncbi:MAG: DUF1858 domain-containing protein [Deltaproteobacteria bacterium]